MQSPEPPGRSLMSVRGNAAPRGMTAHDRIRLTGPSAECLATPASLLVSDGCPIDTFGCQPACVPASSHTRATTFLPLARARSSKNLANLLTRNRAKRS
jgi:hypothetical protein